MDYGLPGSSVHVLLQERILEWVAISFCSDKVWIEWSEVAQSCTTLGDPMDCSLPGSCIHGIFQTRILEWVAISFSIRPPWPTPSPKVCSSSCSLHRWCHPAISSFDGLFSFCPQSFPASGTFPMSCLFATDDQNTEASASASVLPVNIQDWT